MQLSDAGIASWRAAGAEALRALAGDAERAAVLANLAEAALMRAVGLARGAGGADNAARARELVAIIMQCF